MDAFSFALILIAVVFFGLVFSVFHTFRPRNSRATRGLAAVSSALMVYFLWESVVALAKVFV